MKVNQLNVYYTQHTGVCQCVYVCVPVCTKLAEWHAARTPSWDDCDGVCVREGVAKIVACKSRRRCPRYIVKFGSQSKQHADSQTFITYVSAFTLLSKPPITFTQFGNMDYRRLAMYERVLARSFPHEQYFPIYSFTLRGELFGCLGIIGLIK